MMDKGKEKVVHLFPQPYHHDDAVIIGNKKGLMALKEAIETAIATGNGSCILMPSDGENYECKVMMNDEDWQNPFWQRMKEPYAELKDTTPNSFGPDTYIGYDLSKSEDITQVEKAIARDREISENWTNKIRNFIETKSKQEEQ